MVDLAQERGHGSERMMHESVGNISEMLCKLKGYDSKAYWEFMRDQHEILYGGHYSPEFAEWDIEQMHWTGKDGRQHTGAHWSKEQILEATAGKTFPAGTTDCDKYVAFNSYYADMCKTKDEGTILEDAYRFYFTDEDAPEGKVWHYMRAMHENKKQ